MRGAAAAGGPSEMQESERKYKWYYSPKCTFKNEKKAGREKTMVSVLTRAKKCAKISFVFEKDAGVAQSVEQLIRNQQVRCSSHPTSSIIKPCWHLPTGFLIYIYIYIKY